MAGLQEVLTASSSGAKQIWTLLLEGDAAAPPETRQSDSVDGLLETAAACVNCAPTALKVHVLLPGGEGEDTVAGGDAVVLICSDRGAPNAKATALLVAAGAQDAAVTGAACVARAGGDQQGRGLGVRRTIFAVEQDDRIFISDGPFAFASR